MTECTIAREGHNCRQRARAERFSFLVDAEAYYESLADTLEQARRSVLIVGWDIHSRTPIRRDAGEEGKLARLLDRLVESRPELHIHILVWDCNVFCKIEREKLQSLRLGWQTHERIHFETDAEHRLGASHHQKIVVIDDAVAFVGGIDLTARRWDTTAHAPDDPRRVDPDGQPYPPRHDVQVAVDGDAARSLGRLARERWLRATGQPIEPPAATDDPWPATLRADMRQVEVGISRTDSAHDGRPDVREIEALHHDAILSARRWIYLENQYLTSDAVVRCLTTALQRIDGPEVCIVNPYEVSGWLEETVMGALRLKAIGRLRQADGHDRLRIWYPCRRTEKGEERIIVHSKVAVVDDSFITVGSANLSNRSMGLDTECNVFVEAPEDRAVQRAIGSFCDRLLGEHLGQEPEQVAKAIARHGSLNRAVEALRGGRRSLEPLDPVPSAAADVLLPTEALLDPERPIAWSDLMRDFFGR